MTDSVARPLVFFRKLLLTTTGLLSVVAPILFTQLQIAPAHAQATAENEKQGIADTWQGTIHGGPEFGPLKRGRCR